MELAVPKSKILWRWDFRSPTVLDGCFHFSIFVLLFPFFRLHWSFAPKKLNWNRENFEKLERVSAFSTKSEKIRANFIKISENRDEIWNDANVLAFLMLKTPKQNDEICWNIEVWAVQKHVNLVDLVKSFPTNIYLQKSASIQPRTSLLKFI